MSNNDILDMYIYETNTLLEQLESIVLDAEKENTFSQDNVNEIFRIMHTIKGSSAMMEFDTLARVSHRIEDMFFLIREGTMSVVKDEDRPALFDVMLHSVDYFREEMEKVEAEQPLNEDVDSFLGNINSLIAKIKGEEIPAEPAPKEAAAPAPAQEAPKSEAPAPAAQAPKAEAPAAKAAPAPAPAAGQQHAKESLISVNLSKLDQLLAVVSEIVITESMVTASPDLKGLRLDNFTKSARDLRKLTDDLQDVSMSLRMVPVSGTFQKMNRIVRDMSKKLGKRAKLTLIGEDTEVDKTIVDAIGDPIMHIVRNSMDHGLEENEADRVAAGKDPVGEVILSARHTGSEVIIEIKDDGQGVDLQAVLNKAIRQGLAQPDHEYSQKEILNFLMMPGFSTNTEVTEYSGRGVGMDVVKKNVADVGGTVSITSEWGKGMTTTLKIPLTMAIMDGMEVSVGDSMFTIPINSIQSSLKVTAKDVIHDPAQGEMVKIRDSFYPIIRAKDLFQMSQGYEKIEDGILMWVEAGEHSYCLFVDELIGEHQIVVKPLPNYVNSFGVKNYGITGCSILGDGSISIILDVINVYTAAHNIF